MSYGLTENYPGGESEGYLHPFFIIAIIIHIGLS